MGMIMLSLVPLILMANFSNGAYLSAMNLRNILNQYWPYGIFAIGTVVATRIKGPDLSLGPLTALSTLILVTLSNNGSFFAGIVLAFLVCCFVGLFNGTFISLLNIPSVILTLLTAALLFSFSSMITDYSMIPLEQKIEPTQTLFIILFVVSLVIAVVALIVTNRFSAKNKGKKKGFLPRLLDIVGYGLVAVIAGLAGIAMLSRYGASMVTMGAGNEVFLIFVFAAVQSSKLLKNGLSALGYGLLASLMLSVQRNALNFLGVQRGWQSLFETLMTLMLLCAACAAQGGWRSVLGPNLSECEEKS